MRKHYLLYASAAMVALASCSREAKEVITPEMSTSYAKISISMASAPGTRADWGEFDSGSYDESKMALEDIHLVFYDDAGFVVGSGKHIKTDLDEKYTFKNAESRLPIAGSVSDENAVVFQLDLYEGAPLPTKVAAFINVDPMAFNLDKISDIMTNVSEVYETENKGYIMTSAGYYDGEEYVIAAELNSAGIFTTVSQAADAEATKAATIYVERLAAKVSIDSAAEVVQDNQKFIVKNTAGEELTVKFSKTFNWGITGTATEMYMLKQPFENTADWMNDSENCRSYWAKGSNWGKGYGDYEVVEDAEGQKSTLLNYLSYRDVISYEEDGETIEPNNGVASYTLEHTYDYSALKGEALFNVNVPSTSAIVIGTYEISKGNERPIEFGPEGFYLLYAGAEDGKSLYTLYSKEELIAYLVKDRTIYDEKGEVVGNGETLDAFSLTKVGTQFKLVAADWQDKIGENDDDYKTTTLYTDEELTKEVAKTNARHYVGSMGYFFVPIVHHAASKEAVEGVEGVFEPVTGYYGVVRNHSYVLTITSIQGLAAPLDDKYTDGVDPEDPDYPGGEEEPIIPDPDDLKEAYIQASIKVLSWHVVSQNVEL